MSGISVKVLDNNVLAVLFPYHPELVAKMKTVRNRKWHPEYKYWTIPYSVESAAQLSAVFEGSEFQVDPAISPAIKIIFEKLSCNESPDDTLTQADKELKLRGYSPKTRKAYLGHIRRFLSDINIEARKSNEADIKEYLLRLIDDKHLSHSFVNQSISAIKFLFEEIYHLPITVNLPRPSKEHKFPDVLSRSEVIRILSAPENLKHKTILYLVYSAGLRASEVVRLKNE